MVKFVYVISNLLLFIIALYISPCSSHSCIHDEVTLSKVHSISTRSIKYQDIIAERQKDPASFEPLKVHFYVDILERSVTKSTIYNIEVTLQEIRAFIEKTFQVRKRKKPFLLERLSCSHRWPMGINRGKCSEYRGENEECPAKGLVYQIPSEFVDKLEIYDSVHPEPRETSHSGPGLQESNFIVFITSENTNFCSEKDVSSYGTHCRVDKNTNEPLAGIINLCPAYFGKKIYPLEHYYNVLLHELFHILGFSSSLFERFVPCRKGIYCEVPSYAIQEDSDGIFRMMYPSVIESTQKHFECSKGDFGAPMDNPKIDNKTDAQFYPSHWHPVLMYSSIMTPRFSEYDKIYVDNITLAVFASTGWYQIDFNNADEFLFGLRGGCSFGVDNSSCNSSMFLCNPSDKRKGCDLEGKRIAMCTSLVPYHPCGVYQPFTTEDCGSDIKQQFGLEFYALGYTHRCFMLEANTTTEPQCLPVKCKSKSSYRVLVNMRWFPCGFKQQIVSNHTLVRCPESLPECAAPQTIGPDGYFCPADTTFFIAVRMYFSVPSFKDLSKLKNFKNFKATALRGIADKIQVPINYFVNSSLSLFKQIYLDFSICPPSDLDGIELTVLLMKVQSFLDSGSFLHVMKGPKDVIISSTDVKLEPTDVIEFSDHDGFRVLLIFPVLCAIFLLATCIASLIRLFLIQRHRPQRDSQVDSEGRLPQVTTAL